MAYVLSRLRNADAQLLKKLLSEHAPAHAEQGLYLEHLRQNADDADEVIFLFRADDLGRARAYIAQTHAQALAVDPQANLPQMTFLEEY